MPNQAMHIVGGLAESSSSTPGIQLITGELPIDIDADGVYTGASVTQIVLDLSELLGYRLGKQLPMTANYRVNYIRIGARNVDDLNDNDDSQYFAGKVSFFSPSKHRIDAVQAWRMLEKELEREDADTEGLFVSSDNKYKGFRFGWFNDTDISHPTLGAPAQLPNGYSLVDMISTYNSGLHNGVPPQTNAIFDRKVGRSSSMGWSLSVSNEDEEGKNAFISDYEWVAPAGHNIEVVGGLLVLSVEYCSTDTANAFDDDFNLQIDVGVSGWSSW